MYINCITMYEIVATVGSAKYDHLFCLPKVSFIKPSLLKTALKKKME
jgi:hypothetical protein